MAIAGDPGSASGASGNNSGDSDGSEDETVAEDDDNADVAVVDPDGFQEVLCNDMADYVPWGSFMIEFYSGTMVCTDFERTLEASPNELLILIPGNNGDQSFARAAGSGEGQCYCSKQPLRGSVQNIQVPW